MPTSPETFPRRHTTERRRLVSVRVCGICAKEYVGTGDDARCSRCEVSEQVWRDRIAVELETAAGQHPHAGTYRDGLLDAAHLVRTGQLPDPDPTPNSGEPVYYDFGDSSI